MSKKIKAKNKHLRQNNRGHIRDVWARRNEKRSELEQGVFRYREESNFNKKAHKVNAYQERKKKRAQSKGDKKNPFYWSLFS
jgi:hypothetical protein